VGADSAHAGDYRGIEVTPPLPAADFTLAETDGTPYRFAERRKGVVTLLFFGYTYCPDVCPVHMANLATVLRRLTPDVARRVRVVFVTVDPERDTPERLHDWLANFDHGFVGLSGPLDSVNRIQESLRMPAATHVPLPDGGYTVGHGAVVLAVVGDSVRVRYPFGTRQEDWFLDLPKLVSAIPEDNRGN
jgi:protein SCO1/2